MYEKKFFDGTLSTFLTSGVLYSYDNIVQDELVQREEAVDQQEDESQ
jgi:hypothetical protein